MATFVDVFCGAGGWTEGLKTAGLTHLIGIDANREAIATYSANHGATSAIHADVCELTQAEFVNKLDGRRVDIVVGSPPCVTFSMAGPRHPGNPRDSLYEELLKVVGWCQPKFVIIKNVHGFKTKDHGAHYDRLMRGLEGRGYMAESKVVDAYDFQVPQHRKRLIVVADVAGMQFRFPNPEPSEHPLKKHLF